METKNKLDIISRFVVQDIAEQIPEKQGVNSDVVQRQYLDIETGTIRTVYEPITKSTPAAIEAQYQLTKVERQYLEKKCGCGEAQYQPERGGQDKKYETKSRRGYWNILTNSWQEFRD
jgi:hypothetical protein